MPQLSLQEHLWKQKYTKSINNPMGKFCLFYVHQCLMADKKIRANEAAEFTGLPYSQVQIWFEHFYLDGILQLTDLEPDNG